MSSQLNRLVPHFVVDNHLNSIQINSIGKKRSRSNSMNNDNNINIDMEILNDSSIENTDNIILSPNMMSVNLYDSFDLKKKNDKVEWVNSFSSLDYGSNSNKKIDCNSRIMSFNSTNVEGSMYSDEPGFISDLEISNSSNESSANRYDITDMNKQTETFYKKFINLKDCNEDDKVTIVDLDGYEIIEIDAPSSFNPLNGISTLRLQSLSRWWYEQNREKTFNFIKTEFNKYIDFLNMIIFAYNSDNNNIDYKDIAFKNNDLIMKIKSGLKNLKETYLEYDELRTELSDNLKKLDKYLDKVIDMQCKISRIDSLNYM